jgi:hypothetical protein
MHWIGAHVASGNIVTEHDCGLVQGTVELAEQLFDPGAFGHSICNTAVFGFSAGAGDCCLPFGGPGNQRVPHKHTVAGGGTPSIETPWYHVSDRQDYLDNSSCIDQRLTPIYMYITVE